MKKILGVIFLSLLLSGCSSPIDYEGYQKSQSEYKYTTDTCPKSIAEQSITACKDKGSWGKSKISQEDSNKIALDKCNKKYDNCRILSESSVFVYEKNKAKETSVEFAKMINKAKNTCKTLGFEEGTDKFTDCSLKLYSQEVDNKVALKVAEQKSSNSSNSGTMTIYDPVRDSQNQIDRGMKMLSGGCTLGIDC